MTRAHAPEARADAARASEASGGPAALDPVEKSYAPVGDVQAALDAAGVSLPCAQPITIVNDETGESLQVRCGTRRKKACPSCSALYAGDAKQLLRSGAVETEPGSMVLMLTLTAPSFGRVHRVPKIDASPRLSPHAQAAWTRRASRSHCGCGQTHQPDDPVAGTALAPETYDFAAQARWNAAAGRLWNRTATRLTRALGLTERLQYGGTAEIQARGAVHFHLLVRLPVAVAGSLGLHQDSTGRVRARAIEDAVRATTTTVQDETFAWGSQVVADVIAGPGIDGDRHARRTVGYVVKAVAYTAKDLGTESDSETEHHARARRVAERMDCPACEKKGRSHGRGCRSPRHRSFGYAGWPVRRSRDFTPLTFGALRARRCAWQAEQDGAPADATEARSWRFAHQGASTTFGTLERTLRGTDLGNVQTTEREAATLALDRARLAAGRLPLRQTV